MAKRNQTISIARAIAIVAMVFGHANVNNGVEYWVNQFDMALFFICAGYCLKVSHFNAPIRFVIQRFRGLYLPFVLGVCVFILAHNLFINLGLLDVNMPWRGHAVHLYTVSDITRNFLSAILMRNAEILLGGYWFLRELWLASLIGFWILKVYGAEEPRKDCAPIFLACFVFSIIGNWLGEWFACLGFLRRTSLALVFFIFGVEMRRMNGSPRMMILNKRAILITVNLIMIATFVVAGMCSEMIFSNPRGHGIPAFILASVVGSMLVLEFSSWLAARVDVHVIRALIYIGDHTLAILTFHLLAFKFLSFSLVAFGAKGSIGEFPILTGLPAYASLAYCFVGVSLPLLLRGAIDRLGGIFGRR